MLCMGFIGENAGDRLIIPSLPPLNAHSNPIFQSNTFSSSALVSMAWRHTAAKIHSQEREAAQVGITKQVYMRNTSESITGSRRKHLVVPSDPIQWKARAPNGR